MRPICEKCGCEMHCATNGAMALHVENGIKYEFWHTDRYKCDGCGSRVLIRGVDQKPYSTPLDPDFKSLLNSNYTAFTKGTK